MGSKTRKAIAGETSSDMTAMLSVFDIRRASCGMIPCYILHSSSGAEDQGGRCKKLRPFGDVAKNVKEFRYRASMLPL
jgi:acetyl-CoA carboxylase carboxyltransferase component